MVVHLTVNQRVVGSSPTFGASLKKVKKKVDIPCGFVIICT